MRKVLDGWCRALVLAGAALLIGCDRLPESAIRMIGPSFLLTATPGIGSWTTRQSMPTARTTLGAVAIGGILYAVGGYNGPPQTDLGTVEAYDPATDTWTAKNSMPTAREYVGIGALNGILYAVGGDNISLGHLATVEAYDPTSNAWTTKAPTLIAHGGGPGVAAINGILYVVGGQDNSGDLATVEAYDPATNSWTMKSPMHTARRNLGAAVINGILYAVGGMTGCCTNSLATLEAYDPVTDAWTTKTSMNSPRNAHGVVALNGTLYAVGGFDDGFLNTAEAYDPTTDHWTTIPSMSDIRYGPGVAAIDGIFYATGGFDGSGYLSTVEAFTPPYSFTGFFQPVDNPPMVNALKAGSAVPIKFSLNGYQGLDIFASGFPSSQGYACDGSSEDAIEQTVTAGSSSLSYDATTDQYTYVWKTDKAWAGSCRQFQLGLKDGGVQVAQFHFTR